MESQPLNPEIRINPENFHPCNSMKKNYPACKELNKSNDK